MKSFLFYCCYYSAVFSHLPLNFLQVGWRYMIIVLWFHSCFFWNIFKIHLFNLSALAVSWKEYTKLFSFPAELDSPLDYLKRVWLAYSFFSEPSFYQINSTIAVFTTSHLFVSQQSSKWLYSPITVQYSNRQCCENRFIFFVCLQRASRVKL